MPTIKKVAELAGVSIGTVSNVLTGSVRVSDELRDRVERAIRELDYHPNHVARSLKTRRTRILGVMVPDMTIPFFPRIIRGAETAALRHGYSLIAVNSDDAPQRQADLLALLRSQRVEGILIVIAAGAPPVAQISGIIDSGIPVVCLDRVPEGIQLDSVSVDNAAAAHLGVAHLIAAGHRRVAIVTGTLSLRNEQERLQGYRQALQSAGIAYEPGLVWEGHFRPRDVAAMVAGRLTPPESRPSAIFTTNGPTALGVLHALRTLQLHTPGDIGLATFDELTVDDLFSPVVTTVVQPAYDIGYRAAEILLQKIQSVEPPNASIEIRLPATLKEGDTSRLPHRADERAQAAPSAAPTVR